MSHTTSIQHILSQSRPQAGGELSTELWELIERYRGELMNQAFAALGSMEDAEEVVQETFCEVYRGRGKLTQIRSMGAWLRQINKANALNRLRDRSKARHKESQRGKKMPARRDTTGGFSAIEVREAITIAIETLPEDLRAVVVLQHWEHLSCEQIAQRLGISARTVWRHLQRGSLQLYESLSPLLEKSQPREDSQEERK